MPTTAYDIIKDQETVITVLRETPITEALSLMIENDFSFLPVVSDEEKPDGIITSDSILKGISSFGVGLEQIQAHDVAERASIYYLDDNIFDILSGIREKSAVLVVDSNNRLSNIITAYDVGEYFRKRAENLMLVEDIETAIKEHIEAAYTDEQGELDIQALNATISHLGKRKKTFEKLSLYEYIKVLVHENTWHRYGNKFALGSEGLENMLQKVRQTRNTLAHFESEITKAEHEYLKFAANWFERNPVVNNFTEVATPESVVSVDEEIAPKESRYAKLANYLLGVTESKIKLSFEDISEIIESNLPKSAYTHRSWWANDTVSHVQSKQWLEAGWRVTNISLTDGQVTFVRNKEREEMYIQFFSILLDKMRKTDFPLRDANPIGTSWINVHSGQYASFNFSFTRAKQLRVELYIDTGEQSKNKYIFDNLFAQKQTIENKVEEKIAWERLDDKRASRIAIYHQGSITDTEHKLMELQNWAVQTMLDFHQAISSHLQKLDE